MSELGRKFAAYQTCDICWIQVHRVNPNPQLYDSSYWVDDSGSSQCVGRPDHYVGDLSYD